MKTHCIVGGILAIAALFLTPGVGSAQYNIVRSFEHSPGGINTPIGSLTTSGTVFYGTGSSGGSNNYGGIFRINSDGTGYTSLHSFAGGLGDGASPNGSLVLAGSVLYGVTGYGGPTNLGTVFGLNIDGTGFALLHSFSGSDGANPESSLLLSGSTLYGVTYNGGTNGGGVIFRINTDGSGFAVLYNLPSASATTASLALSGSLLYGTTRGGGTAGFGTIFQISTNGTGYTNLHSFGGYPNDGATPSTRLVLSGSMLFGMTAQGGANNDGTLFQINTNGSGYGILQNSGMNTWGSDSLMVQGSTLYGMIYSSSVAGNGAIFSMNTNGSAFTVFHTFSGPSGDGWLPMGGVTWVNGTLYGMTTYGGGGNVGTMFAISASGSGYSVLYSFDAGTSDGFSPYGALTFSGDTLFGTTYLGGTYNLGTAFSVNTNGTPYSVLHVFAGGRTDGLNPSSGLTLSGPTLFGTTHDWFGQIFSINEDGSGFSIVEGGSSVANYDVGTPVVLGSAIYNTSPSPNGYGDVFSLNTDGSGLQVLHTFQGGAADGAGPGDLICLGSTLFGVTASGGSTNNLGTIFKINTDGSGYSILHVFNGGANDSATPTGALTPFGGSLYGLTSAGGIFVISTNGTGFSILHTFSGLDGSGPVGSLTLFGPTLYGMTSSGGINGLGTIFEINTNGTEFAVLHHFSGAPSDGAQPAASLTLATSMLYGMTEFGGSDNGGVIFSLPTGLAPVLAPWPSTNINELVLWQYTPAVTGTGYTFGLSNAPSGMTVGSASGTISWTPTQTQATYTYSNIAYVVYQSGHPIAATGFTVTVNDINMAPAFEYVIGPQTVYAATPLTITDMATNTDIWATSLAYAVVSAPAGVGIDPNTGVVTWTPTIGQAGTNTITVSATDTDPYAVNARNLSTTNSFLVIVIATSPPSFVQTPTDQVIAFGQGFSFSALATGSPPPSYQWQFSTDGLNYTNLVGETAASYQTLSSSLTNIGFYRAVAANLAGTNTSAAASLSFLNAELLPVLILYGPVGADYTIQSKPALTGSSNWISVTNITLPASQPYIYVDPSSLTNRQQFYRALPQ